MVVEQVVVSDGGILGHDGDVVVMVCMPGHGDVGCVMLVVMARGMWGC
jgi:hypothetical protein